MHTKRNYGAYPINRYKPLWFRSFGSWCFKYCWQADDVRIITCCCTVTTTHRFTKDLEGKVRNADLIVVAVGKPAFIPGDWIKEGAIVIDVGINRLASGKLVGDVDFDIAKTKAAFITPVPGGVGPMTVASLIENTLIACEQFDK